MRLGDVSVAYVELMARAAMKGYLMEDWRARMFGVLVVEGKVHDGAVTLAQDNDVL